MMFTMSTERETKPRQKGKSENFSTEQIEALRSACRRYVNENELTQQDLADRLKEREGIEIGQQAVGNFLGGGGLNYNNASGVARLLGFAGIDDFFENRDVASGKRELAKGRKAQEYGGDDQQEFAMRMARQMGVSEKVIEHVNARLGPLTVGARQARSWATAYSIEQDAEDARRLSESDARERRGKKSPLKLVPES